MISLLKEIDKLVDEPRMDLNTKRLRNARAELNRLYTLEETYWAQRLRITWMKEGDRNTFHVCATH